VRCPEGMRERFPGARLVVDQHQHCATSSQSGSGRATGFPPNGHHDVRQVTPELRSVPGRPGNPRAHGLWRRWRRRLRISSIGCPDAPGRDADPRKERGRTAPWGAPIAQAA
jgi:hypothetical protein